MFNTKDGQRPSQELPHEYQTFEVESITPHIGAVVRDVDLSKRLSNAQLQDVLTRGMTGRYWFFVIRF